MTNATMFIMASGLLGLIAGVGNGVFALALVAMVWFLAGLVLFAMTTKLRCECPGPITRWMIYDRHDPADYATSVRAFVHRSCGRLLSQDAALQFLRTGEVQK